MPRSKKVHPKAGESAKPTKEQKKKQTAPSPWFAGIFDAIMFPFLIPPFQCPLADEFALRMVAASVARRIHSDGAGPEESPTISSAEI